MSMSFACARPRTTPPVLSPGATQRLAMQTSRGDAAGLERVVAEASRTRDLRLARRAVELGKSIVAADASRAPEVSRILAGPLSSLARHCGAAYEAAGYLVQASAPADAASVLAWEVQSCRHGEAGLEAARLLRGLDRCGDALSVLQAAYPYTASNDRVALFDEVASCSNDVDLRRNLSFAAPAEIEGYYRLLERREAERRLAEERAMQEELLRQQQQMMYDDCVNRCLQQYMDCQSAACGDSEAACIDTCG
jgi:hypothetical protein